MPNQKYVLKSIELLIDDRQKMNNLGAPIRLISHDVFNNDSEMNVKMRIEGKKRNGDLIFDAEPINDKKEYNSS